MAIAAAAQAQNPDPSTPKTAAESMFAAIERGDADALGKLVVVEGDPQQRLSGAYIDMILAARRLAQTAREKFPGTADAFAQGAIAPEDTARIAAADESIDGDLGTLKVAGRAQPLRLRRVEGAWRVIISQEPTDQPRHLADQLALLRGLSQALSQTADEIAADKFASAQDAQTVLKERLGSALSRVMQSGAPATAPATRPDR